MVLFCSHTSLLFLSLPTNGVARFLFFTTNFSHHLMQRRDKREREKDENVSLAIRTQDSRVAPDWNV